MAQAGTQCSDRSPCGRRTPCSAGEQLCHGARTDARWQNAALQSHRRHAADNDEEEKPSCSIFYVGYTLDGVSDPQTRPVTFLYNGGPGSASIWLHMGSVGPVRVVTASPEATGARTISDCSQPVQPAGQDRPGVRGRGGHGLFAPGGQSHHPKFRRHRSGRAGVSEIHPALHQR